LLFSLQPRWAIDAREKPRGQPGSSWKLLASWRRVKARPPRPTPAAAAVACRFARLPASPAGADEAGRMGRRKAKLRRSGGEGKGCCCCAELTPLLPSFAFAKAGPEADLDLDQWNKDCSRELVTGRRNVKTPKIICKFNSVSQTTNCRDFAFGFLRYNFVALGEANDQSPAAEVFGCSDSIFPFISRFACREVGGTGFCKVW
jgi:hypothetical protein